MKKIFGFALLILTVALIVFIDYNAKREKYSLLAEEYQMSNDWQQTELLLNTYLFNHGYYPDSLGQIDDRFNHEVVGKSLEDVRESGYRLFIDPFSGTFYYYIPIINKVHNKPDGYYLLSAGIDSKINSIDLDSSGLKLYDSLSFNYFDFYFGKKDLLVRERSIEDVIKWRGSDYSLNELIKAYNSNRKRVVYRMINFYGVVERINEDYLIIAEPKSKLKSKCNLALVPNHKTVALGDTIQIKGNLNEIEFKPDTLLVFLNCSVLENK